MPSIPSPFPSCSFPFLSHTPADSARRATAVATTLLLLVILLMTAARPALAHTSLASSDPVQGATLTMPFDEVTLTFSRAIELLPSTMRLTDAAGRELAIDVEVSRSAEGDVVVGTFAEALYAGTWRVHWQILASDSHPREGIVTVVVDDDVVAPAPAPEPSGSTQPGLGGVVGSESRPPPVIAASAPFPSPKAFEYAGDLVRVIYYLGLMVAIGLTFFKAGPHRGEASNALGMARAVALGAGLALVAGVLEVAMHAGALSAAGWSGMFDGGTWAAIRNTGLGPALWLRTAGLVLLLGGAMRRAKLRLASGPDVFKLAGAALVIASFQFVGHTASTAPAWVIRTADVVHVVTAAVWVGGLVGLAMLSGHADRLGRARTAARFSTAATTAVAAVAVAGTMMAFLNIPSWAALFSTGYGRLLLAKLSLVAVLGALGAYNHLVVVPRLTDGDTEALDDLRRTVSIEVVLILVIVVLTALLINTTPM
ncbi:MAG: copper transport protein [Glaciecola sp.]